MTNELIKNKQEFNVIIGSRLKLLRKDLKLSQAKLGEEIGITFQQVKKYEKGINRLPIENMIILCKNHNLSIDYFFQDIISTKNIDSEEIRLKDNLLRYFRKLNNKSKEFIIETIKNLLHTY